MHRAAVLLRHLASHSKSASPSVRSVRFASTGAAGGSGPGSGPGSGSGARTGTGAGTGIGAGATEFGAIGSNSQPTTARVFAYNPDATPSVSMETRGKICTIILSRPVARNAVDRPTAEALADAFRAFDQDPTMHVAVLFGANGTFCAGADLKALASGNPQRYNRLEETGDGPMGPTRMTELSKPVIAACTGHVVAGGLELALLCDLRVAHEDAVFGVFCRRFGVPLIDGGTFRLPRIVGHGRAMDMILTGRAVDAKEALGMGLVTKLVPKSQDVRTAAEQLAEQISAFPQECMRRDRASALQQWGMSEKDALHNEFQHGLVSLAAGAQAGALSFAQGKGRGGQF
ncbi:enoyl-CoA hydratase [Capsaspora owczarzaki ATCC 30864]|uniref:Enoyl-CoA hydratase n=1 Tax=Capsaspora owczarzaki (strain ATCC 30864) TaxID=595528 RepID=A0A0D2X4I2_CAPO3|nr:enoyl-CoA hydratase [Capsaspora owczarzaki ATCC 30864]KJE96104.1 enoyl-CoA hydratase [Capsaspora owczarzaki ATCC 30864]|eukprot:XP_004345222.2 enoyl-CoA hydratase [Capsaspora owczarzaki ATCC 30864]